MARQNRIRRALGVSFATVMLWAVSAADAAAQGDAGYPNKPIRILIGFSAGGGNDFVGRVVAEKLADSLGKQVVIENKTGAGGMLAAETVARAPADGYTLMIAPNGPITINPAAFSRMAYDPARDFVAVTQLAAVPLIFAVNNDIPVRSVNEAIAWAKANPTKANFGGSGGSFRMVHALVKAKTGMPVEYITYRASSETVAAMMAGEVAMTIVDAGPISGALKGGKVRGVAVTSSKRMPAYPDLPTMTEAGIPGLEIELWMGLFAPAGTPAAILAKLEAETNRVLKRPDVIEKLRGHEVEPVGGGAAAFAKIIEAERVQWAQIAKEHNIKFD